MARGGTCDSCVWRGKYCDQKPSDNVVGLGQRDSDGVRREALLHGEERVTKGTQAQTVAGEPGTGVQPAVVVQEVPLAWLEAQAPLASRDRAPDERQIGVDYRAPPSQAVLPQTDGYTPVDVDGEDLRRVSGAGAEVGGPGLGEHDGRVPPLGAQAGEDIVPVGQQHFTALVGRVQADEQHQPRRMGHAGAFRVCLQFAMTEPGEADAVRMGARVVDGGEPVGATVGMRHDPHQPLGDGEHLLAGQEPVDGHEAGVLEPGSARFDSVRRSDVNVVGREERPVASGGNAHRRAP